MKRNQHNRGWSKADWLCFVLIVVVVLMILNACAALGYIGGAVGMVKSEVEMGALEERIQSLEDQDLWSR